MKHVDIAIVGSGLAGSALAVALSGEEIVRAAGRPLKIALIEAREIPEAMPPGTGDLASYDLRASALTAGTLDWLRRIGIWPEVRSLRTAAFSQMEVWVEEGTGSIAFDAAEVGADELGEVVENRLLVAVLLNRVKQAEHVALMNGLSVEKIQAQGSANHAGSPVHSLSLSNGEQLTAELVVAADGAHSAMRDMMDMPVRQWDYGHDAIVCNVEMEKSHGATARQRFGREGPVAFLPLGNDSDKLCTIVWSQNRARAEALMALPDEEFKVELAAAIEHRLGAVVAISDRASFPLRQRHAQNYVRPGFVLVADAAHTVHPLAGQGINLGLADVAELVETIVNALDNSKALGDIKLLKQFQRKRKTDNLAMMAIIEGFKRIYQPLPLPAMLLRNEGMKLIDHHYLLKNQIIRYAMGVQAR